MMRLLPQTLFGRLAWVLFGGLLLAQLISMALQFHDRGQRLFQASGYASSERMAEIVRLLDDSPMHERQRLLKILNVPPLRVTLEKDNTGLSTTSADTPPARLFRQRLSQLLGPDYAIDVAVSDQPIMTGMHSAMQGMSHSSQHMQSMGMVLPEALIFYARVRLSDGQWVSFENQVNKELLASSSTLIWTLLILLAIVALISLLAVRWLIRPISMLTQAARQLGTDINQPPLRESGPVEVVQAARAFNAMQSQLKRFIEDRGRLLSAISHDLKTPITRMRLRAEMLEDAGQRESFIRNLDEMQQITSETLDFLRSEEIREPLQQLDLCELLSSLQQQADELQQPVTLQPCPPLSVMARPQALKRCLGNLIDNAIKYGDKADISASHEAPHVVIRVTDHGPGIADDQLEQVFEPFYRIEHSRNRDSGGSGLGLSIARNIALSLGGELHLHNLPEGGLQATLLLPDA